ncbi:hypothetical protein L2E82_21172 [Cichorium intybus]|uniref:Uncharacterized protein n=1 Tax=Cichorium intybus TaxID=13427 RepID=A0ACB9DVP0_CICIN|nr:hypothetical protein L2E82_21172 [Cichorium intybus]
MCVFVSCIDQASVGVVDKWGRLEKLAEPGLNFFNPCAGQYLACVLSTRIKSLEVKSETKTKDNVFVQIISSIQYRVLKQNADDAFYELQNPLARAQVPRMTLDQLFEQKDEVAKTVLQELQKVMGEYGYIIEHILMVDIIHDPSMRRAINEINAAQRLQLASVYKGEADKILQVKTDGSSKPKPGSPSSFKALESADVALDDWKPLIMKLSNKEPEMLLSLLKANLQMIETRDALEHESGKVHLLSF